jgi:hypothetical protein
MTSFEVRTYVHYAITAVVLTGVFWISNCSLLKAYMLMLVVILLHWLTNDDKCCISQIDYKHDDKGYSKSLFSKIGITLTDTQTSYVTKLLMLSLIVATYFKLKKVCGKIL